MRTELIILISILAFGCGRKKLTVLNGGQVSDQAVTDTSTPNYNIGVQYPIWVQKGETCWLKTWQDWELVQNRDCRVAYIGYQWIVTWDGVEEWSIKNK